MKREYATTSETVNFVYGEPRFPDPVPPKGNGWELRSVAVHEGGVVPRLVWAWQRDEEAP